MKMFKKIFFLFIALLLLGFSKNLNLQNPKILNIGKGWAANSINAVIFRENSVVSYKNYQFSAFYDSSGNVMLAKRKLNSDKWIIRKTKYKGDVKDAHKCISIMIDGDGYLHMAWNQHDNPLNYCRSKNPLGLILTNKMSMTGVQEKKVTYPQFFKMPNGDLIFLFRDGSSGNGNLVINYYNTKNKTWRNLHKNLIDGEGQRNAYWQATVDNKGILQISWVWRETYDVSTNHDICYAKSTDGGKSWIRSNGKKYKLPITAETAEYVVRIPQAHELINQTSMCTDNAGNPYIVSYWTPEGSKIPQYNLVYYNSKKWETKQITKRKLAFSLSGGGTKRIPISRPQILVDKKGKVYVIFRDAERGDKVTIGICNNLKKNIWQFKNLTTFSVDMWEPTYDTELWRDKNILDLFVEKVGQGDAESLENIRPQMVSILEWQPDK